MHEANKKIKNIDDKPKTRSEIAKMIQDMFDTDENGDPEKGKKEIA